MIRKTGIDISKSARDFGQDLARIAELSLEYTLRKGANDAKGLTSTNQPPVKVGEGERKAHPGLWADESGNLANSIQTSMTTRGSKIRGELFTDRSYASELEGKKRKRGGTYSVIGYLFENNTDAKSDLNLEDEFLRVYKEATEVLI